MRSLNCSNLCIALRPNRYFKVKLKRILYVKTRHVALETAKKRRNASKNVNSRCVFISHFDYVLLHHCFCYIGNSYCNICRFLFDHFKLYKKLTNYWYCIKILICNLQSVLANEVNFLYGFQKSNAMLLLETISLALCTQ